MTRLSLGDLRLDVGPSLGLSSITEQVHDDGALGDGLVDLKQVLAGDPAILDSILPGLALLPHANNDIQAVVTQVEALAVTLGAVADQSEGVVLEVVLLGGINQSACDLIRKKFVFLVGIVTHQELLLGPVLTLWGSNYTSVNKLLGISLAFNWRLTVNILLDASEVNGLDTTSLLLDTASESRASDGSRSLSSSAQSNKSAARGRLGGQLAGHRPHGVGETSGRHLGWLWRRGDW